jgi:CheY-like chemotaxis protein
MDAIHGFYGVENRRDGRQGSLFWFAIPYKSDWLIANMKDEMHAEAKEREMDYDSISSPVEEVLRSSDLHLDFQIDAKTSLQNNPQETRSSSQSSSVEMKDQNNENQDGFLTERLERKQTLNYAGSFLDTGSSSSSLEVPIINDNGYKGKTWEILLVDDSPAILKLTSMMLRRQGHTVVTAENGEIALQKVKEKLESNEKRFDFIIMDLQMPVMDGLEATKRLRLLESEITYSSKALLSDCRQWIVGMSANSDHETINEAMSAGIDCFMEKPFTIDMFNNHVHKLLINQTLDCNKLLRNP